MYRPASFREDRLDILHELIRSHPLATLITAGRDGLQANLVPFLLVEGGERGILQAHVAKANDQLAALREGAPTLVVFRGPQCYVTPNWYPSKAETHQVVPTWNYVVVQAGGTPRVVDDPAWVRAQIEALTASQEASRPAPWRVTDAPDAWIAQRQKVIIGIEIPIDRLEGKWKMSQNRPEADRKGVEAGLRNEGMDEELIRLIARRDP